ncbi:AAA family ATPase [Mammaliicoccus sciuri]|uniref:AAA family ATPase n=1 Tax=Mammaliicoccus sciuri TaxID=1296 RepID=UPI002DB746B9|nr:AAA family ATPase [Mammaliicoccus sciuri]MEB6226979.1 AAA family ATPase [Mammaliicoccus sciuri]
MDRLYNDVIKYTQSGIPFIFIEGFDTSSIDHLAEYISNKHIKDNIFIYDLTTHKELNGRVEYNQTTYKDINNKLLELEMGNKLAIIQGSQGLLEFENGEILENIAVRIDKYEARNLTVIFIGDNYDIPENLKKYSVIIEKDLPSNDDLKSLICKFLETQIPGYDFSLYKFENIISNLRGLNEVETNQILSVLFYEYGINIFLETNDKNDSLIFNEIKKMKVQILKKTGTLNIVNSNISIEKDVGGLTNLMTYLKRIRSVLNKYNDLNENNISIPKGVLLIGKPGNGKSLVAKATSNLLNLPLISFDISKILGKYVGESEKQMKKSLQIVQAMSPCVLWIDEIEKAFSGINNPNNDTMRKILGIFLTWMSDENKGVYVVATANAIQDTIPPEMVRKGRFDDIFYIDNPGEDDRMNIFKLHLEKRNIFIDAPALMGFAEQSENLSGAEIEYCCNSVAIDLVIEATENENGTAFVKNRIKDYIDKTKANKNNIENEDNIKNAIKHLKDKNKDIYDFMKNLKDEDADPIDKLFKERIQRELAKDMDKFIESKKREQENRTTYKHASNE